MNRRQMSLEKCLWLKDFRKIEENRLKWFAHLNRMEERRRAKTFLT